MTHSAIIWYAHAVRVVSVCFTCSGLRCYNETDVAPKSLATMCTTKKLLLCIVPLTLLLGAPCSKAEIFELKSGGTLQGKLLNPNEKRRTTYQIRLETGGDVTLDSGDVMRVIKPSAEQLRYQETLKQMPADTAELHWKMAELCRDWSLPRERRFHLEQAVRLDPDHEAARRALKYKRQEDGTWARLEDIKKAQGYVRYGGEWVTQREAELAAAAEKRREAALKWQRDLRLWRRWLKDRRRQSKAIELIESIDDPLATEALIKLFRSERNTAVLLMVAEILGRLDSPLAAQELGRAAMQGDNETENELRLHCLRQLEKNERYEVVPSFVSELRSSSNVRVRRAAYALRELGDEAVVLPLIKALRTTHVRYVGGRGNGNINLGPGGLSVGRTKPRKVSEVRNNKEVLSALVKLTKKDFDYDQQRWLDWYLYKTTPPDLDLRRDL